MIEYHWFLLYWIEYSFLRNLTPCSSSMDKFFFIGLFSWGSYFNFSKCATFPPQAGLKQAVFSPFDGVPIDNKNKPTKHCFYPVFILYSINKPRREGAWYMPSYFYYDIVKGEVRSWSNLISEERVKFFWTLLKGEVRSWSNLISEERVKFFWTKQWKPDENRLKNKEVMKNLKFRKFFRKHFLTKSVWICKMKWVDDVIASLLAIYFVHKILKILIFCPNLW